MDFFCDWNANWLYVVVRLKGPRPYQEDATVAHLDLLIPDSPASVTTFGVFDGHGGAAVSRMLSRDVPARLCDRLARHGLNHMDHCLREAFHDSDDRLQERHYDKWRAQGSTGCFAASIGDQLVVANSGDSRAIMSVNGQTHPLSHDQKVDTPAEKARMDQLGAKYHGRKGPNNTRCNYVVSPEANSYYRVNVARGFGDGQFKPGPYRNQHIIPVQPEITTVLVNQDVEFIVLATDGLWDVMSSEQVISSIRESLKGPRSPAHIRRSIIRLAQSAIHDHNTKDNVSIVVAFNIKGRSLVALAQRMWPE
eukprot:scpid90964/ scgid4388/ Probable protein phosphatase 2C 70